MVEYKMTARKGDALLVPDPRLPELDEIAAGSQRREAGADQVAGERIKDDVRAPAFSSIQHLAGKIIRARVHDVSNP
jgi:hypothetical protein